MLWKFSYVGYFLKFDLKKSLSCFSEINTFMWFKNQNSIERHILRNLIFTPVPIHSCFHIISFRAIFPVFLLQIQENMHIYSYLTPLHKKYTTWQLIIIYRYALIYLMYFFKCIFPVLRKTKYRLYAKYCAGQYYTSHLILVATILG